MLQGAQQAPAVTPSSLANALPGDADGEQIFKLTCATCHNVDGTGSPRAVVGFDKALPDFTDCSVNTVERFGDWDAVVHRGGRIRGLDRHMPSFGDALSDEQIEKVVKYVWQFCKDPSWPRGDLNFPRAFFTEKAYPENESVWTTGVTGSGAKAVENSLVYERRIGVRNQYEVTIPVNFQQTAAGSSWSQGLGDIELAIRRTFYANLPSGSIFAAGAAVTVPTGKETEGLGNGFAIYEPFAMFGQALGVNGFLQLHGGLEVPSDHDKGKNEGYLRTAIGYSLAGDHGYGRSWSPMVEVLVAKPADSRAEWDVVPQMQVSLSKLQHILISVGVRVPVNEREDRKPQLLTYFLWDWFDGGLFEFWK